MNVDPKIVIANNIKKYLDIHNMTQKTLAEKISVKPSTMSDYLNHRSKPSHGVIQKIADVFGVNKSDIDTTYKDNTVDFTPNKHLPHNAIIPTPTGEKVPLYGSISAGMPLEMIPVEEIVEIPSCISDKYPDAFLLRVNGDSMNRVVPNGAYALIDPCIDINNGDIVAVSIDNFAATLKRYFKLHNSTALEPDSYDPSFTPRIFNDNSFETVNVLGKMVWFMSAFDARY